MKHKRTLTILTKNYIEMDIEEKVEDQTTQETTAEEQVEQQETQETTEAVDWMALASKELGREIKSPEDLIVEKELELPEDIQAIYNFKKEKNRPISDWFNSQKDWSNEPEEERLKAHMKMQHSSLTDEQINTRIKRLKKGMELSEDDMDDPEIVDNVEYNKTEWAIMIDNATKALNADSEKYQVPIPRKEEQIKEVSEEFTKDMLTAGASLESLKYGEMSRTVKGAALAEEVKSLEGLFNLFKSEKGYNPSLILEVADYVKNKEQIFSDYKNHIISEYKSESIKEQGNFDTGETIVSQETTKDDGYERAMKKLGF